MALKLRTRNSTYRITVNRGGEEAVFTVQPLDPEATKQLLDRHSYTERVKGELQEKVAWFDLKKDKICRVIQAWEGIRDEDGNEVECTREAKLNLYKFNPAVIDEVLTQADDLAQEAVDRIEEEIKNSKPGPKK